MTKTAAENAQAALARSWAAWGSLARAWQHSLTEMTAAIAEWAVDEQVPYERYHWAGDVDISQLTKPATLVAVASPVFGGVDEEQGAPTTNAEAKVKGGEKAAVDHTIQVTIDPPTLEPLKKVQQGTGGDAPSTTVVVDVGITAPTDQDIVAFVVDLQDQAGTVIAEAIYIPLYKSAHR